MHRYSADFAIFLWPMSRIVAILPLYLSTLQAVINIQALYCVSQKAASRVALRKERKIVDLEVQLRFILFIIISTPLEKCHM